MRPFLTGIAQASLVGVLGGVLITASFLVRPEFPCEEDEVMDLNAECIHMDSLQSAPRVCYPGVVQNMIIPLQELVDVRAKHSIDQVRWDALSDVMNLTTITLMECIEKGVY